MPKPAMNADDRRQHEPDDRQAGRELAVDDVVAVDRLGEQARQRPLGALAVDRIEGEREARAAARRSPTNVNDAQDAGCLGEPRT